MSVAAGELSGVQIVVEGEAVITLIAEDMPANAELTLEQYAARAVENLRAVFAARVEQRRPAILLRGVGVALAATLAFATLALALARVRRRVQRASAALVERRTLHVAEVDMRPMLGSLLGVLASALIAGLILIAAYVWLSFVLAQFPYSRPLAARLGHWLLEQLGQFAAAVQTALPGLFMVALILVAARLLVRAVGGLFAGVERGAIAVGWLVPTTARTTRVLVATLIWVFALVFAYPYIPGSGTDAFKGISLLLGVMISLGSAGFINQFMSGLVIVYSRALNVGDVARVGDVSGVVQRVGLLATRMMTPKEEIVTVPNAVVVSAKVITYSRRDERIDAQISACVTIGYDVPWRQIHGLLLQAAGATAGLRPDPRPYVVQTALSDFYVEYELRAKLEQSAQRFSVQSDLYAAIQDAFNDAGVQIMSPHFESQPPQKVYVPRSTWFAPPGDRTDG